MTNTLNEFIERKMGIDRLSDSLKEQLAIKAAQIKEAETDNPNLPQWQLEMRRLQNILVSEPEAATHSLCDEIQRKTGLTDVFNRNTDATNQNLKGEAWVKFVLGLK